MIVAVYFLKFKFPANLIFRCLTDLRELADEAWCENYGGHSFQFKPSI